MTEKMDEKIPIKIGKKIEKFPFADFFFESMGL